MNAATLHDTNSKIALPITHHLPRLRFLEAPLTRKSAFGQSKPAAMPAYGRLQTGSFRASVSMSGSG